MTVSIRERRAADLPALVEVLSAQQATSGYPHRWPLPFPTQDFLTRPGELGAWVAVVGEETRAGQFYRRRGWVVVGHGRPHWLPDDGPDVAFMMLDDHMVHEDERVES